MKQLTFWKSAFVATIAAGFAPVVMADINNPGVTFSGAFVAGHCVSVLNRFKIQDAGAICQTFTPAALTQTSDTNIVLTLTGTPSTALLQAVQIAASWSGTLAAARLNGNVVQGVSNDTNITGSITGQNLTLGWTGTLAAARLNANVVQSFQAGLDIGGAISGQVLALQLGAFNGDITKTLGSLHTVVSSLGSGNVIPQSASADGQIYIGSGASNFIYATIPNCPTGIIQYTSATHIFNCSAAGTGTLTSVSGSGLAVSSGGSPTPNIAVTAAVKADMQAATSNVVAVTPAVAHQADSSAKAWGVCTNSAGTYTLTNSYNISGATCGKSSAGVLFLSFVNAFASTAYGCSGSTMDTNARFVAFNQTSASQVQVDLYNSAQTASDASFFFSCFGRQ